MTTGRAARVLFIGALMGLIPVAVHAASSSFIDNQSASYKFGYIVGQIAVLSALLAGAIKCMTLLSRPTTSRICATSLMLVLLGWFGASAATIVQRQTGVDMTSFTMLAAVGSAALLFAAGLVTGIIGLITYKREYYVQGRAQAIWAIVLSSIYLLIFGGSFIYGLTKGIQNRMASVDRAADGQAHTYEKPLLNFSISPPADARWSSLKPELINQVACLAFRKASPDLYSMVIAESLGESKRLTTAFISEFAKSNLTSAATVSSQHEEPETVNGIVFNHIVSKVKLPAGQELTYEHWITTLNGYSYQLIFWTDPENTARQEKEARRMLEAFHILDPDRKATKMPSGTSH